MGTEFHKMRVLFVVLTLLPAIYCTDPIRDHLQAADGDDNSVDEFPKFISRFHKRYSSGSSEGKRRLKAFSKNYKKIMELKKKGKPVEVNGLADLTDEERDAMVVPLSSLFPASIRTRRNTKTFTETEEHLIAKRAVPASVDLRSDNCMGPIRNQGPCGSCYSFASIHAVEFQHCRFNGTLTALSEQDIVDCSPYSYGCRGGNNYMTFLYLADNGAATANQRPYTAEQNTCPTTTDRRSVVKKACSLNGYPVQQNVLEMEYFVSNIGPLSVGFRYPNDTLFVYLAKDAIWEPSSKAACDSADSGHAITIVGYGTDNGKDYWLIRNSWGTTWGDNGYGKMIKGVNACNIESWVDFPIVYGNDIYPNEKEYYYC